MTKKQKASIGQNSRQFIAESYRKIRRARRTAQLTFPTFAKKAQFPCRNIFTTPVIITLTSYPPRFQYLHLTLRSLLCQRVRADRVVLWIARDDALSLPRRTRDLVGEGLEIRLVEDIASYKKLIPAIEAWPDHFLAIADDDIYYPPGWLAALLAAYNPDRHEIPCHRAHRIALAPDGSVLPYRSWEWDIAGPAVDARLVPTGVGGVLYPPGSLHGDVTRRDLFAKLCPNADDLWLYWMARRRGFRFRRTSFRFALENWPGTTENGLFLANRSANDAAFSALEGQFGQVWREHDLVIDRSS